MTEASVTINFKLVRAAKKEGGDRYESLGTVQDFVIYIPQKISRVGGKIIEEMKITFEPV